MAGYSGTPLPRKLGLKPGCRVHLDGEPEGYRRLLEPLPAGVVFEPEAAAGVDLIHLFTRQAGPLADQLAHYRRLMAPDGTLWVSWPKKAARVATDVTEDVIRRLALPLG